MFQEMFNGDHLFTVSRPKSVANYKGIAELQLIFHAAFTRSKRHLILDIQTLKNQTYS